MKLRSFLPAFLLLAAALLLGGCAGTDAAATDPNNAPPVDSNGQPVSTVPWNKPSSWESGGALGSMMGQ